MGSNLKGLLYRLGDKIDDVDILDIDSSEIPTWIEFKAARKPIGNDSIKLEREEFVLDELISSEKPNIYKFTLAGDDLLGNFDKHLDEMIDSFDEED